MDSFDSSTFLVKSDIRLVFHKDKAIYIKIVIFTSGRFQ